jgi:hypothetical protein
MERQTERKQASKQSVGIKAKAKGKTSKAEKAETHRNPSLSMPLNHPLTQAVKQQRHQVNTVPNPPVD